MPGADYWLDVGNTGTTFTAGPVTFTWNAAPAADTYSLWVRRVSGEFLIVYYQELPGTSTTVNNMPCDGSTLSVQLGTHVADTWQTPQQFTYTAATGCPASGGITPGVVSSGSAPL